MEVAQGAEMTAALATIIVLELLLIWLAQGRTTPREQEKNEQEQL